MGSLRKAAKGSFKNRGRWDESFKSDLFPIPGKPTRIRLGPSITEVPMHWVEFVSKEKGKTGFFALCLNHDYDEGEEVDNGCPCCELEIRASNYLYGYVISRAAQKRAGGVAQVQVIRLTANTGRNILGLSDIAFEEEVPDGWDEEELPDATDPKYGFDISLAKVNASGKIEYQVHVATNGIRPLKKDERAAFKAYADQVDFAALAKAALEPRDEMIKSLTRVGLWGESEAPKAKKKSANYEDYDDELPDEDEDEDEDEALTAKPKKKKKAAAKKKPKAKKVAALSDDDEEDDDDEDEEELTKSYADADEDDEPDFDDEDDDEDEFE